MTLQEERTFPVGQSVSANPREPSARHVRDPFSTSKRTSSGRIPIFRRFQYSFVLVRCLELRFHIPAPLIFRSIFSQPVTSALAPVLQKCNTDYGGYQGGEHCGLPTAGGRPLALCGCLLREIKKRQVDRSKNEKGLDSGFAPEGRPNKISPRGRDDTLRHEISRFGHDCYRTARTRASWPLRALSPGRTGGTVWPRSPPARH